MFPSEMAILVAITTDKHSSKQLLDRPSDVIGEYIGYLYNSLVNRGFIRGNRSRGFRLTPKGGETLKKFLLSEDTQARNTLRRLQQMNIEVGQKAKREIEKLENEASKII